VQEADGGYAFCSVARTADGFETSQEWKVLPGTPLHDWLLSQRWPVSKEGYHTTLQVRVLAPFPPDWLGPLTTTCYQYFTPQTITRALQVNGFENAAVVPYGLTYDVTSRAGLSEAIRQHMPVLARAEAELARKTHSGAGPWLFAWATKPIE
jgi:hypothetical protein